MIPCFIICVFHCFVWLADYVTLFAKGKKTVREEIRVVYELFDFHTNYDTNLIRIVYLNCLFDFDTNCVYELLIRI